VEAEAAMPAQLKEGIGTPMLLLRLTTTRRTCSR